MHMYTSVCTQTQAQVSFLLSDVFMTIKAFSWIFFKREMFLFLLFIWAKLSEEEKNKSIFNWQHFKL